MNRRFPGPQTSVLIEGKEVDFAWPASRLIIELDSWSDLAGPRRARPPRGRARSVLLVQPLDDHRLAHAAGGAHGLEPDRRVERVEVVEQRGHDARAGHPERVAERDRAAERVELL